jgi:hypothetical protein
MVRSGNREKTMMKIILRLKIRIKVRFHLSLKIG